MAVDKLVDSSQLDADLTSVANAIRTKGGTSASLAFPAGFVSAVEAIPTGGGGYSIEDIASTTGVSGDITADLTNITIRTRTFQNFKGIESFHGIFGNRYMTQYCFCDCTSLKTLVAFSTKTGIGSTYVCSGCTALEKVDYTTNEGIATSHFSGCSVLNTLILRRTAGIVSLNSTGAFNNSPFASAGSGGTLYVPSALISTYQSATNWSTILGYANNSIQAIEGSQYENYYADGTPVT